MSLSKLELEYHIAIDSEFFFLCRRRLQLYGQNTIEIAVKTYWELFCSEILNPFYLFQIFSITLWCLDEYWYYASCVFFLSAVSIFTSLYETRKVSKFVISLQRITHSIFLLAFGCSKVSRCTISLRT